MSQELPTAYFSRAVDQSWCPGYGDLTRAEHSTKRPTNVRRQFNSIISHFRVFVMDKCMSCMQMSPINVDYKNIYVGEHEDGRKKQITDRRKGRMETREFGQKFSWVAWISPIKKFFRGMRFRN